MSEGFSPFISFESQSFIFFVISLLATLSVIAFFLYENMKERNILIELLLAGLTASTLGTSIFFGLIGYDVIL